MTGLLMPALIGMTGLGTEVGLWLYQRQTLQSAADSAALSAAAAYYYGNDYTIEADGVAASYGFVDGVNGTNITVSRPPTTGNYTSKSDAIEVVVEQPQSALFTALFNLTKFDIRGRAVAMAYGGSGCTLSLDPMASGATTVKGNANVTLNGCNMYDDSDNPWALTASGFAHISAKSVDVVGGISNTDNIEVTDQIAENQPALSDPYNDVPVPNYSGCDSHNFKAQSTMTISPGVYCGGMSLNAGAVVTLNPGIYYLDAGGLSVNGGATLKGTGVTLVFTSSKGVNYANATINGGATVSLTAPMSGPTAGIVLFGDRNMPTGTSFKFNGGANQYFGGAMYLPKGAVDFAGGASTSTGCTQIIGNTVTFTGNSALSIDCKGSKIKPIGSAVAKLIE